MQNKDQSALNELYKKIKNVNTDYVDPRTMANIKEIIGIKLLE